MPAPPDYLTPAARELWEKAVELFPLDGVVHGPLLQKAVESFDTAERCRQAIEEDGLTWVSPESGAVHKHPLLAEMNGARREFRICWNSIGLESPSADATPEADEDDWLFRKGWRDH